LDEASALLVIHLLEQNGIGAVLASSNGTSVSGVGELDTAGIKVVCLCYLEPGNFARARYLRRRLRRHIPDAVPLAIFWGYLDDKALAREAIECEVATGLEEAVQRILDIVEPEQDRASVTTFAAEEADTAKTPWARPGANDAMLARARAVS
jgi:hypothetical protein